MRWADNITTPTIYLSLEDLKNAKGYASTHESYMIEIEDGEDTILRHAITTSVVNDRFVKGTITLAAALVAGEYRFRVYSMDVAASADPGDKIGEVERGLLTVTRTATTYTEHTGVPDAYKEHE